MTATYAEQLAQAKVSILTQALLAHGSVRAAAKALDIPPHKFYRIARKVELDTRAVLRQSSSTRIDE